MAGRGQCERRAGTRSLGRRAANGFANRRCETGETARDVGDGPCSGSLVSETRRDTGDVRHSALTQRRLSTHSPRMSYLTCRQSWHGSWHGAADSSSSASAISAIGRVIGAASAQNARGRTYGKERSAHRARTTETGHMYIKAAPLRSAAARRQRRATRLQGHTDRDNSYVNAGPALCSAISPLPTIQPAATALKAPCGRRCAIGYPDL